MDPSERAVQIAELLEELYPEAECELDYRTPWELLVATVLSAQSTDVRVNQVTPALFERWPGPAELAAADAGDVEDVIRSVGFYRQKARNLQATARQLMADHDGEVPKELDALTALPGVGRKTAKVVLGEAFGIPAGVTVDTHVQRLSRRLGLADHRDAEKVADGLEDLLPRDAWIEFSLRLILHGRRVCHARSPKCDQCGLEPVCPKVGL
jgi:endonuclease-3